MNNKTKKIITIQISFLFYFLISVFILATIGILFKGHLINSIKYIYPEIMISSFYFVFIVLIIFFTLYSFIDLAVIPKLWKYKNLILITSLLLIISYITFISILLFLMNQNIASNIYDKVSLSYHCFIILITSLFIVLLSLILNKLKK